MIKSPAELALMQAAADIMLASLRYAGERTREGMTPADIDAMIAAAHEAARRQPTTAALVLIGEASAYPHGSHKPQVVQARRDRADATAAARSTATRRTSRAPSSSAPTRPPSSARSGTRSAAGQQIAIARREGRRSCGERRRCGPRAPTRAGATARATSCPALSHRTGHGIGMEVHEPVNLVHGETTPLAPGMCFSDEPGIYIPGKFGVRLEDCCHMTRGGPEILHPAAAEHRPAVRLNRR